MVRYNRQDKLLSQKRISKSKVCIVGVGGLGCTVSELIVRAGVLHVTLIDFDKVSISNLHRQSLFDEKDVAKYKAECAREKLLKINSKCKVVSIVGKIEDYKELMQSDIVIECTDNMNARNVINNFCKCCGITWIHGAVNGFIGQVKVCRGGEFDKLELKKNSLQKSVLNTAVYATAAIQANEALKVLSRKQHDQYLIRVNLKKNEVRRLK